MIKMTINEFKTYKTLTNKAIDLFISEKHSSLKDIKIIYNIIMGFPFCLDQEGHYTYEGKFYNSIEELPDEAKEEIAYQAYRFKCEPMFYDSKNSTD